MLPSFENGELVIIHKANSLGEQWYPSRGQVVIAVDYEDDYITKRVIGLEGEYIEIKNETIFINNKKYKEYLNNSGLTDEYIGYVPKNHVWVIGDNRSETWSGFIHIDDIKGLVLF